MINPRVEKIPKEVKSKLRTHLSLYRTHLRLYDYEATIDKHRILHILTSIQISHLLLTIIDITKVTLL